MIAVKSFADRTVAVFGLGRSGVSAARALDAGGAAVWAWDDGEGQRAAAETAGIALTDLYDCDWNTPDVLVLSPGVPHTFPAPHPVAALAADHGKAIVCDVDLLARTVPEARYIGITGTNGKSTVTALIGHILGADRSDVQVGGNFGVPALDLEPLDADGTYVLELSSYQLERVPNISLDVAVLINIGADHLDRHGGIDGYVAAKKNIFARPKGVASAVVGMDDRHCRNICFELMVRGGIRIIPISGARRSPGGVYVECGILFDDLNDGQARVLDLNEVGTLPGMHNWQNAAAAYAAARIAGMERDEIAARLETYPGLAHRQERIATIDGIVFVNDSKATNAEAAVRALGCYEDIYWIAGGEAKKGGFEMLHEGLANVRHAYLIGEAAPLIGRVLGANTPHDDCGDLASAFKAACDDAAANGGTGVVLLSPACASFDQFANFEARGDAFRALVEALQ